MSTETEKKPSCIDCRNRVLQEKEMISTCEGWKHLLARMREHIKVQEQTLVAAVSEGSIPAERVKVLQQQLVAADEQLVFSGDECKALELQLQRHICPSNSGVQLSSQKILMGINKSVWQVHRLGQAVHQLLHPAYPHMGI